MPMPATITTSQGCRVWARSGGPHAEGLRRLQHTRATGQAAHVPVALVQQGLFSLSPSGTSPLSGNAGWRCVSEGEGLGCCWWGLTWRPQRGAEATRRGRRVGQANFAGPPSVGDVVEQHAGNYVLVICFCLFHAWCRCAGCITGGRRPALADKGLGRVGLVADLIALGSHSCRPFDIFETK